MSDMSTTSFPDLDAYMSIRENRRKHRPSAAAQKRHIDEVMAGPWGENVRAWTKFDGGDATDVLALERKGALLPRGW